MQDIEESVFRENIKRLCTVVACRVIGDEATYNKFLARQCASGSQDALQLQAAIQMLSDIHAAITICMQEIEIYGHASVRSVMEEVRQSSHMVLGRCNIWAVCALTGKVSNDFVILRGSNVHMLIDARFRAFLHCLWMIWHLLDVEVQRVERFLCDNCSGGSIKNIIQEFMDSTCFVTDEQTSIYFTAYRHVRSTLQQTLQSAKR